MPTIKFTKNYTVQSVPPETFEKDTVVKVSNASANHFLNRGVVEIVEDEPKKKPEPKVEQKAEEPETGSSSQPAPVSQKRTPKRRGRPPKEQTDESSSSTTTTDSPD